MHPKHQVREAHGRTGCRGAPTAGRGRVSAPIRFGGLILLLLLLTASGPAYAQNISNLTVTEVTHNSASFSWSMAPGRTAALIVQLTTWPSNVSIASAQLAGSATGWSYSGLTPETSYRFVVFDDGEQSVTFTTLAEEDDDGNGGGGPARSVSLSASPNPVVEGSSVTVTATLSGTLGSSVTIPITLTAGTAEERDFGALAGIDIAGGELSGRGRITTRADDDGDDETFTVALGALPFSVTAGSPSSVRVTITDRSPATAAFTVDAECDGEDGLCRALTGAQVRFEDTSSGAVRQRRWDFGDGAESRNSAPRHSWSSPGFYTVTLRVGDGSTGSTESTASRTFLVEAAEKAGNCESSETRRCLLDSRYALELEWRTAEGETGDAMVAWEGTNDSGLLHFFERDNWEVVVKVLDGCSINGHVWVYGASATTLGYAIRVTDTVTDDVKVYENEPGATAEAITDNRAFAGACASGAAAAANRGGGRGPDRAADGATPGPAVAGPGSG